MLQESKGDQNATLDLGIDCRRCNWSGALTGHGRSMNWIANILAGLIGSSLGQALLGEWGPQVAGMAIVPSILGAVILVIIVAFVVSKFHTA